jgi:CRISPR/Cas system-associated exonuclease Cas4 (RecB family)
MSMAIDRQFIFSAHKLQDYLDCERRFELKYLAQQQWPAIRSEPVYELEQQIQLGEQFHLFAQQFFSHIPEEAIQSQIRDAQLAQWWQEFVPFARNFLDHDCFAEHRISFQLEQRRFIAILDLLVIHKNGDYKILDWKTNKKKPGSAQVKKSIQSRLYPLLLLLSEEKRTGSPKIDPNKIEMTYWFANYPHNPESFRYSNFQFQEDLSFIQELIQRITSLQRGEFQKTSVIERCKFCQYRSLCERGSAAGSMTDLEDDIWDEEIEDIDFSQIGEIAF